MKSYRFGAALAAAIGTLCLQAAEAGPADYVYTPMVETGEIEIGLEAGSADSAPRETVARLGLGYGAREWWFTELAVKYKKEDTATLRYDAIEWENKFQLTETGKYPLETGVLLEIEVPRDRSEGVEVKTGLLLQKDIDRVQLNGNVLFEKSYNADTPGHWAMGYQWQAKYRWRPTFEFGAQGFGEMGEWNRWESFNDQFHNAGPAIFGKIPLGPHRKMKYNLAWLFGYTDATPDNTVRLQAELEF